MNKINKFKSKISKETSFFLIMLFAIGGFITIMLPIILNNEKVLESNELSVFELEKMSKDIVLKNSLFKEYSDGSLYQVSRNYLSDDSWEFVFKFDIKNHSDIPENVTGFMFKIRNFNGDVKLTEVFELTR